MPQRRGGCLLLVCICMQWICALSQKVCHQASIAEDKSADRANPFRGFFPFMYDDGDDILSPLEHSLGFLILAVNDIVTAEDTYDWSRLETGLNFAEQFGKQLVIRFYLDNPSLPSGVPDYLNEGDNPVTYTAYDDYGGGVAPDYDNERLLVMLENFVAELAATYDDDPRLVYIQIGIFGFWGEWHSYPHTELFPSRSSQERLLQAFHDSFNRVRLVVGNAELHQWILGDGSLQTTTLNIGWHDDVFGDTTYSEENMLGWWFYMKLVDHEATERYFEVPIGGEIRPDFQSTIFEDAWSGEPLMPAIDATKPTWLLLNWAFKNVMTDEELENARLYLDAMGYHVHLSDVTFESYTPDVCPVNIDDGQVCVGMTVTVSNPADVPCYFRLAMRATLLGQELIQEGLEVDLTPHAEEQYTFNFAVDFQDEEPDVVFELYSEDSPYIPAAFASEGATTDGLAVTIPMDCLVDETPPEIEASWFVSQEFIMMWVTPSEEVDVACVATAGSLLSTLDADDVVDAYQRGYSTADGGSGSGELELEFSGLRGNTEYLIYCSSEDTSGNVNLQTFTRRTKRENECGAYCVDPFIKTPDCECACPDFWSGSDCDVCSLECENGGTPESDCTGCYGCENEWGGDECDVCTLNCDHGRPNSDCTECVCDGEWWGAFCQHCDLDCLGGSSEPDALCDKCECSTNWEGASCDRCGLTCKHSGTPNEACSKCDCVGGWLGKTCGVCDLDCVEGMPDEDCRRCICFDQWSGVACDVCEPECGDRECGGDGCGGECGTCADSFECSSDGVCECALSCENSGELIEADCVCECVEGYTGDDCSTAPDCLPFCDGCGPSDGCGGDCGCEAEAACVAGTCTDFSASEIEGPIATSGALLDPSAVDSTAAFFCRLNLDNSTAITWDTSNLWWLIVDATDEIEVATSPSVVTALTVQANTIAASSDYSIYAVYSGLNTAQPADVVGLDVDSLLAGDDLFFIASIDITTAAVSGEDWELEVSSTDGTNVAVETEWVISAADFRRRLQTDRGFFRVGYKGELSSHTVNLPLHAGSLDSDLTTILPYVSDGSITLYMERLSESGAVESVKEWTNDVALPSSYTIDDYTSWVQDLDVFGRLLALQTLLNSPSVSTDVALAAIRDMSDELGAVDSDSLEAIIQHTAFCASKLLEVFPESCGDSLVLNAFQGYIDQLMSLGSAAGGTSSSAYLVSLATVSGDMWRCKVFTAGEAEDAVDTFNSFDSVLSELSFKALEGIASGATLDLEVGDVGIQAVTVEEDDLAGVWEGGYEVHVTGAGTRRFMQDDVAVKVAVFGEFGFEKQNAGLVQVSVLTWTQGSSFQGSSKSPLSDIVEGNVGSDSTPSEYYYLLTVDRSTESTLGTTGEEGEGSEGSVRRLASADLVECGLFDAASNDWDSSLCSDPVQLTVEADLLSRYQCTCTSVGKVSLVSGNENFVLFGSGEASTNDDTNVFDRLEVVIPAVIGVSLVLGLLATQVVKSVRAHHKESSAAGPYSSMDEAGPRSRGDDDNISEGSRRSGSSRNSFGSFVASPGGKSVHKVRWYSKLFSAKKTKEMRRLARSNSLDARRASLISIALANNENERKDRQRHVASSEGSEYSSPTSFNSSSDYSSLEEEEQ